jgi:hypothetical protein
VYQHRTPKGGFAACELMRHRKSPLQTCVDPARGDTKWSLGQIVFLSSS